MPYLPHTLVQFGGSFEPGNNNTVREIFECGIRGVSGTLGAALGNPEDYLDKIKEPLSDWFANPVNGISNQCQIEYIKVNNIRADGRYQDQTNSHRYDLASPRAGGAVPKMPSILSLCYSWRTNRKRGIGSHGRMYVPNFTYGSVGSMAVSPQETQAAADAAERLLMVLRGEDDSVNTPGTLQEFHPVVASAGTNRGQGPGDNVEIIGTRVGSIYDVQRRRKNALREVYAYQTLG